MLAAYALRYFVCLEWGGPAVVSGSGCIGALVGVRTAAGLVLCNAALIELTILVPRPKKRWLYNYTYSCNGLHMYLKAPMPVLQPRPTQHDFATNPRLLSVRWCVPSATLSQPTRYRALIAKRLWVTFSKTTGKKLIYYKCYFVTTYSRLVFADRCQHRPAPILGSDEGLPRAKN